MVFVRVFFFFLKSLKEVIFVLNSARTVSLNQRPEAFLPWWINSVQIASILW